MQKRTLTAAQLAKRHNSLENSLANQQLEGFEPDEKFLTEITWIMENVADDRLTGSLEELKEKIMRREIF